MNKAYENKKEAFSLAEAMVVLVIVAILMAVSAPLVAKKMKNDSQRYLFATGSNVFVAAGANQVLTVGRGVSDNKKFVVNGNAVVNGNLTTNNKDAGDNDVSMTISGEGIRNPDDNNLVFGFDSIDTAHNSATTNIKIAIPDYSRIKAGTNALTTANEDGFVYVSNAMRGFTIASTGCPNVNPSGSYTSELSFKLEQDATQGVQYGPAQYCEQNTITMFPMLVPISQGQCYQCTNDPVTINGKTYNNAHYNNACYFIPLKNAETRLQDYFGARPQGN